MRRSFFAAIVLSVSIIFTAQPSRAQTAPCNCNLVVNGDFTAGNSGFTQGPGMLYQASANDAGHECVGTSFSDECTGWPAGGDHTSHTGKFLSVDGSRDLANVVFWKQDIKMHCPPQAGKKYTLTFWAKNAHPGDPNPYNLNIDIDVLVGATVVGSASISKTDANWVSHSVTFSAPVPTSLALRQRTGSDYADFGIDDISLTYCPEPVIECHCPPGWLSNSQTAGVGASNIDGGVTDSLYSGCKRKMCDITCAPNSPPAIQIGTWGFLWGNTIWAYGTSCNGGAAIRSRVPCRDCVARP